VLPSGFGTLGIVTIDGLYQGRLSTAIPYGATRSASNPRAPGSPAQIYARSESACPLR